MKTKVSVLVIAYNHEASIRKCLDSILIQKTNFDFDIIVHDDCSTDRTANIIKEYEQKYPDKIKPIYQTENQYSQGRLVNACIEMYELCDGEYIATCESDDYWTDENKLQIQVDLLDKNPDCVMCGHQSTINDTVNNRQTLQVTNHHISTLPDNKTFKWNIYNAIYCHTSSRMYRSYILKERFKKSKDMIGDVKLFYWALSQGNMIYINKNMSTYNYNGKGIYSKLDENEVFMRTAKAFFKMDQFFNYKYHKIFGPKYNPVDEKKYFRFKLPLSGKKSIVLELKRERIKT